MKRLMIIRKFEFIKRKSTAVIQVLGWWEIIYLNYWLRNVQVRSAVLEQTENIWLMGFVAKYFKGVTTDDGQEGVKTSRASSFARFIKIWIIYHLICRWLLTLFCWSSSIPSLHHPFLLRLCISIRFFSGDSSTASKTIDLDRGHNSETLGRTFKNSLAENLLLG